MKCVVTGRSGDGNRDRREPDAGPDALRALACTPDGQHQYTSFVLTAHLIEAAVDASMGTVGDALDNALMESTIGLYKTELIKKEGPVAQPG